MASLAPPSASGESDTSFCVTLPKRQWLLYIERSRKGILHIFATAAAALTGLSLLLTKWVCPAVLVDALVQYDALRATTLVIWHIFPISTCQEDEASYRACSRSAPLNSSLCIHMADDKLTATMTTLYLGALAAADKYYLGRHHLRLRRPRTRGPLAHKVAQSFHDMSESQMKRISVSPHTHIYVCDIRHGRSESPPRAWGLATRCADIKTSHRHYTTLASHRLPPPPKPPNTDLDRHMVLLAGFLGIMNIAHPPSQVLAYVARQPLGRCCVCVWGLRFAVGILMSSQLGVDGQHYPGATLTTTRHSFPDICDYPQSLSLRIEINLRESVSRNLSTSAVNHIGFRHTLRRHRATYLPLRNPGAFAFSTHVS